MSVLLVSIVEVTKLTLVLSVLRGMGPAGAMGTVPGQEGGGSVNLDFPSSQAINYLYRYLLLHMI